MASFRRYQNDVRIALIAGAIHRESFFAEAFGLQSAGCEQASARVSQVALDQLIRALAEGGGERRTIVFSDSRDEAAVAAAGIELNHFRDLVRQFTDRLLSAQHSLADLMRSAAQGQDLSEKESAQLEVAKSEYPDAWAAYTGCVPVRRRE